MNSVNVWKQIFMSDVRENNYVNTGMPWYLKYGYFQLLPR